MGYYATCNRCKGTGRFYDSKSGKTFDCRACDGSGSNKSLYETRCQSCNTPIIFPIEQQTPRFCKDCRNIQLEKRCGQYGCNNTIRYKAGWDTVPTYCKRCETKRAEYCTASICPGVGGFSSCGKLIWSPPGKSFKLCSECGEKERAAQAAQWETKRCKNCGQEIRYKREWTKVPDLCKSCVEIEKAKWKQKQCEECSAIIKYHADWTNVPSFCKNCQEKHKASRVNRKENQQSANQKVASVVSTLKLTEAEQRQIHDEITGNDYMGYKAILAIGERIKAARH